MVKCEFCKIIRKKLDKNLPFCDLELSYYNNYKDNFEVREATAICRGFNLCKIHTKTIKKDNKLRLSRGEEIPYTLDTIKKLVRSDI